jgi:hypothetical protein
MTAPHPGSRQPRQMDAGILEPEIGSFRLHLAAEGKSAKTIRTYTEAARWFAAEHLLGQAGKNCWEQADSRDIQEWMQWLLGRGSDSYASNQFRALAGTRQLAVPLYDCRCAGINRHEGGDGRAPRRRASDPR